MMPFIKVLDLYNFLFQIRTQYFLFLTGVGPYEFTIKDGKRWSASQAYMHSALHRRNLTAQDGSMVTKLLFEGTKAVGVEYVKNKQTVRAKANKEIILSLGEESLYTH